MAPKPPRKSPPLAASAPEMWRMKHGPPPKRPRSRPIQSFHEPEPFNLPGPDVPMSGEQAVVAASCPAYVSFCKRGSDADGGLVKFGVPPNHIAGTPTILEGISFGMEGMSMSPHEAECNEVVSDGWVTSDEDG